MSDNRLSRRQKAAREAFRADVKAALLHKPTRRLLGAIFDSSGLYDVAPLDANAIAYANGKRAVGLQLRAILDDVDPLAFVALEAEAVNRRTDAAKLADIDKRDGDAEEV